MGTYLDAVLTEDGLLPLANGTADEIKDWLRHNPEKHDSVVVCPGRTLQFLTVEQYLSCF